MDNDMIYTFTDEKFGSIGVIKAYGEPWFIVNDVFKVFGYNDHVRPLTRVHMADKAVFVVDTSCRKEAGYAVNGKGLLTILDYLMAESLKGAIQGDEYIIEMREKISQFEKWILSETSSLMDE